MLTGDLRTKSVAFGDNGTHQPQSQPDAKTQARQNLESVGFDLQESEQYTEYVQGLRGSAGKWKGGFRWFYLCAAGVGAGSVAVAIQFILRQVNALKFDTQQWLFEEGHGLGVRYLVWISTCLLLSAVAGALVCYVEPLAAGSGIPEIKCILNGIDLPNVLHLRTLVSKAFGIVCSVAAGLPCGKEGPMIHSGAIVAAQMAGANAGPVLTPYRLNAEARDFVAGGAAAGVAAAFGAPIGGVLFAVEEGASHMNPTILVRTFVCAAVSALTVRFFAGPMEGTTPWGTLGTDVPVEFGRFEDRRYNIWELPVFALMGVCGGLFGALFNGLNTRLSKWRMRHVGPRGHLRYLEVFVVTASIVSFNFFAPLLKGGPNNMSAFCPAQKLFVDVGGEAIRDLFHGEEDIHPGMLLFFALVHYAQTVWTYGLGVPSGLFVPSLLGGAAFGRILGQATRGLGLIGALPGTYALIGATAMLSGMARITISLVVILMETTGEAEWGVPIFLVVMAAKWTGDLFNKGIYDIHIELRHVPLLEHRAEKQMLSVQARDCMASPLTVVSSTARVQDLVDIVGGCRHHAFPVVEPGSARFLGMVERNTLLHLLLLGKRHGAFTSQPSPSGSSKVLVSFGEMIRHGFPRCPPMTNVKSALTPEDHDMFVDLLPYTNKGSYTVQEHTAAMRCYLLFRTMGLRHLPVLGPDHSVCGMLTRKDLLAAAERHEEHVEQCPAPSSKTPTQNDMNDAADASAVGDSSV